MIEPSLNTHDLILSYIIKSIFFAKVLPYKSICVLIKTPLPRAIWTGKEHVYFELLSNAFMLGKLLSIIGGKSMNNIFDS